MKGMIIGAGLAIGGIFMGFVFATNSDVLAEAKWWDLMTAFGTVAAAGAAVGLGVIEGCWRHRDHERRGLVQVVLLSGAVCSVLAYLTDLLSHIRNGLDKPEEIKRDAHEWHCIRRRQLYRRMREVSALREEVPLYDVGGVSGRTCAQVASAVSGARVLLALMDTQETKFLDSAEDKSREMLEEYWRQASEVFNVLLRASKPLADVANSRRAS
ncbi:hypothetical protein [Bordetella trematum]|uniref:hypothetical protein n=1 Tax=Bordetella trematum TaxID=123899 RepID=UPI000D9E5C3D|nr:hypothetical protein [Bordetella trematum]SPU54088.1 Uncharacterised protein [Bordetella trematum]VDH06596.1 Uncharacterised protein [Bordetella trematum]